MSDKKLSYKEWCERLPEWIAPPSVEEWLLADGFVKCRVLPNNNYHGATVHVLIESEDMARWRDMTSEEIARSRAMPKPWWERHA